MSSRSGASGPPVKKEERKVRCHFNGFRFNTRCCTIKGRPMLWI